MQIQQTTVINCARENYTTFPVEDRPLRTFLNVDNIKMP